MQTNSPFFAFDAKQNDRMRSAVNKSVIKRVYKMRKSVFYEAALKNPWRGRHQFCCSASTPNSPNR